MPTLFQLANFLEASSIVAVQHSCCHGVKHFYIRTLNLTWKFWNGDNKNMHYVYDEFTHQFVTSQSLQVLCPYYFKSPIT